MRKGSNRHHRGYQISENPYTSTAAPLCVKFRRIKQGGIQIEVETIGEYFLP